MLIQNRRIIAFIPDTGSAYPIIYMHHDREEEAEEIWRSVSDNMLILICIADVDWNRDMSPWPMRKVFKGEEDFGGNAGQYLALLTGTMLPEIESCLGCEITWRGLIGYSLSGIFALYALYNTDFFSHIGSMSGSMWYEDLLAYMRSGQPLVCLPKVYLSLGDQEKKSKNPLFASVEDCTLRAKEILLSQGADVIFELNPGNHFVDTVRRISKAVKWLVGSQ